MAKKFRNGISEDVSSISWGAYVQRCREGAPSLNMDGPEASALIEVGRVRFVLGNDNGWRI